MNVVKPPIAFTDSRHIPKAIKTWVALRDGGRCVSCGSKVDLEYDHCPAWNLLEPKRHDPDKIFLRCKVCHGVKSGGDTTAAAKVKRVGAKHRGEYRPTKTPLKGGAKLQGRGFDKTKSRGFDGKVKDRKGKTRAKL